MDIIEVIWLRMRVQKCKFGLSMKLGNCVRVRETLCSSKGVEFSVSFSSCVRGLLLIRVVGRAVDSGRFQISLVSHDFPQFTQEKATPVSLPLDAA